ncbi:MAG TPA: FAD:protein FMN transferase, partial [Haloferula sp.]
MFSNPPAVPLRPDPQGVRSLEFRALGTNCSIKFRLENDPAALNFAAAALGWLEHFEAKFSRYRPTSLVSRINDAAGGDWIEVDPEMEQMLDLADNL